MKKSGSIILISLMVLSLNSCGNDKTISTFNQDNQDSQVEIQSKKKTNLSMDKSDSKTVKELSDSIKELSFNAPDKITSKTPKQAEKLEVKFTEPTIITTDLNASNSGMYARSALSAMNTSKTWEEGFKIGFNALSQLAKSNLYVAKVSWAAANSSKSWETGFKVVAVALNHIGSEKPNSAYEACSLVMTMMNAAKTWEDGYRAGFAALQVIGRTDNHTVKSIIDNALRQSTSAPNYEAAFNILKTALQQLRRSNI